MNTEQLFLDCLEKNKDKLFRICCTYAANAEDSKDLFQELVLQFWKALPRFQEKSSLNTYIYRIAINVCLKYRDKQKMTLVRNFEFENFEDRVQKDPMVEQLYEAIKKLEKIDKAIVMLYLEGLPYKEIAGIMDMTENHIAVKMKRIKPILLTHLKS